MNKQDMSNEEMTSPDQLEMPMAVKYTLEKIDKARLSRAKEEIWHRMSLILNNVNKILEHNTMIAEFYKESEDKSLIERPVLMEKIKIMLETSMVTQDDLQHVLAWLSNLKIFCEDQIEETSTHKSIEGWDIDQWVERKEEQLHQWLDFIQQCLKLLTDICLLICEEESTTATAENKIKTEANSRDVLQKYWKGGKLESKMLLKIKDLQIPSTEKILENEKTAISKAAELLNILQDFTSSPLCNQVQVDIFQAIIKMIEHLSKAFDLRSKVFHKLKADIKATETEKIKLKIKCDILVKHLTHHKEKSAVFRMNSQKPEAQLSSRLFDNAQLEGNLEQLCEGPKGQENIAKQVDHELYTDWQFQAPDSMLASSKNKMNGPKESVKSKSGQNIKDVFDANIDLQINLGTEIGFNDKNNTIFHRDQHGKEELVKEMPEIFKQIENKSDPQMHPYTDKVTEFKQFVEQLCTEVKTNIPENISKYIISDSEKGLIDSRATPRESEDAECNLTDVTEKDHFIAVVPLQTANDSDVDNIKEMLEIKAFQKAVHYVLEQTSMSSDRLFDQIQENDQWNQEVLKMSPVSQRLFQITEQKIKETLAKFKENIEIKILLKLDASKNLEQKLSKSQMTSKYSQTDAEPSFELLWSIKENLINEKGLIPNELPETQNSIVTSTSSSKLSMLMDFIPENLQLQGAISPRELSQCPEKLDPHMHHKHSTCPTQEPGFIFSTNNKEYTCNILPEGLEIATLAEQATNLSTKEISVLENTEPTKINESCLTEEEKSNKQVESYDNIHIKVDEELKENLETEHLLKVETSKNLRRHRSKKQVNSAYTQTDVELMLDIAQPLKKIIPESKKGKESQTNKELFSNEFSETQKSFTTKTSLNKSSIVLFPCPENIQFQGEIPHGELSQWSDKQDADICPTQKPTLLVNNIEQTGNILPTVQVLGTATLAEKTGMLTIVHPSSEEISILKSTELTELKDICHSEGEKAKQQEERDDNMQIKEKEITRNRYIREEEEIDDNVDFNKHFKEDQHIEELCQTKEDKTKKQVESFDNLQIKEENVMTSKYVGDKQETDDNIDYYKLFKDDQLYLKQSEVKRSLPSEISQNSYIVEDLEVFKINFSSSEMEEIMHNLEQRIYLYPSKTAIEERYWTDVKSQRNNLHLLDKAEVMKILPIQLLCLARDLTQKALNTNVVRLGYLFRKYICIHTLHSIRQDLLLSLSKAKEQRKENEMRTFFIFLHKLDDYQRMVVQRWADKQAIVEHERRSYLSSLEYLFKKLNMKSDIHFYRPHVAQHKAQTTNSREDKDLEVCFPDRFISWMPHSSSCGLSAENITRSITICNTPNAKRGKEISDNLGKNQISPPFGPRREIFPEIPLLLEYDISLPRIKALRTLQASIKEAQK